TGPKNCRDSDRRCAMEDGLARLRVAFQFAEERRVIDAQLLRGAGAVPAVPLQHGEDVLALNLSERTDLRSNTGERIASAQFGGQIVNVDEGTEGERTGAFHRVLQLADVA